MNEPVLWYPLGFWLHCGIGPIALAADISSDASREELSVLERAQIDSLTKQLLATQKGLNNLYAEMRGLRADYERQDQRLRMAEHQAGVAVEKAKENEQWLATLSANLKELQTELENHAQALSALDDLRALHATVQAIKGDTVGLSEQIHRLNQQVELFLVERKFMLWKMRLFEYTILVDVKRRTDVEPAKVEQARSAVEVYSQEAKALAAKLLIS